MINVNGKKKIAISCDLEEAAPVSECSEVVLMFKRRLAWCDVNMTGR